MPNTITCINCDRTIHRQGKRWIDDKADMYVCKRSYQQDWLDSPTLDFDKWAHNNPTKVHTPAKLQQQKEAPPAEPPALPAPFSVLIANLSMAEHRIPSNDELQSLKTIFNGDLERIINALAGVKLAIGTIRLEIIQRHDAAASAIAPNQSELSEVNHA